MHKKLVSFITSKFKKSPSLPTLPKITINKKLKLYFLAILVFVITLVAGIFYRNKLLSLFFVAKVGDAYITRSEFNKELNKRYSDTILDNLATLQIVSQELAKNNIVIKDEHVNAKLAQIEASLGGAKIDDVLNAQGIERSEFITQIKLQLGAEEIIKNNLTITDSEIDEFIKTNGSQLVSIVEVDKKEEARNILKNQKAQTEIANWLATIKTKYSIIKF